MASLARKTLAVSTNPPPSTLKLSLQRLLAAPVNSLTTASANLATSQTNFPNFGIMFDIDGVIVRGKTVLPTAPEAFSLLWDRAESRWRVPTIFVTNAGNTLRQEKADKLSDWLGIPVTEDQVVMSHSPLKMFTEYHNKHVSIPRLYLVLAATDIINVDFLSRS